jgi:hypothetical protein
VTRVLRRRVAARQVNRRHDFIPALASRSGFTAVCLRHSARQVARSTLP